MRLNDETNINKYLSKNNKNLLKRAKLRKRPQPQESSANYKGIAGHWSAGNCSICKKL